MTSSPSRSTLMSDWAHGWAVSRHTVAPTPRAGGWYIPTGVPGESARYLLHDGADVVRVTGLPTEPHTWIKVSAPADRVPMAAGWQAREPAHLMHRLIKETGQVTLPDGYTAAVRDDGNDVVQVTVRAADGGAAAWARAGIAGDVVVFDQVGTEPAHQRQGLGRAAMTLLSNRLTGLGEFRAVLVATDDGRALYEKLGWTFDAPVTIIEYVP
ncbi:GNAT family N-acetyltransferase [Actinoplanes sp. NPDC051494]|uniref:GNAT family N-acetyltransferase n=1 Tax=Actinoplanes sp. NPDC051494 TaxID=3363907 RepID=UPI003788DDEA